MKRVTIKAVCVAVVVAVLVIVVAGRRGQSKVVRIAAHCVPLFE